MRWRFWSSMACNTSGSIRFGSCWSRSTTSCGHVPQHRGQFAAIHAAQEFPARAFAQFAEHFALQLGVGQLPQDAPQLGWRRFDVMGDLRRRQVVELVVMVADPASPACWVSRLG